MFVNCKANLTLLLYGKSWLENIEIQILIISEPTSGQNTVGPLLFNFKMF